MENTCPPQRGRKSEARSGNALQLAFRGKFTIVASERGVSILVCERFYDDEIGRRFPGEVAEGRRLCELSDRDRRLGPDARLAFGQLLRSLDAGVTSEMYYEGKVLELLFLIGRSSGARRGPELSRDDAKAVDTVRAIIDAQYRRCPKIAELAIMANTSTSKLQKDFKTAFGRTIHEYLWETRLAKALEMLDQSSETVGALSRAVGCMKPGRFSKLFKAAYGLTPTEYRRKRTEKAAAMDSHC
jgi:AraC-like DNA-binding protein